MNMPRMALVLHPLNKDCKSNLKVTYCYNCGTHVKDQKYCHGCGSLLNWNIEESMKQIYELDILKNKRELVSNTCGNLMTKEDFINYCKDGCLMDDDGVGEYSDGIYVYDEWVSANFIEIDPTSFDNRYSHVVWYNK